MGYDTSIHPVDHAICARITGYILGDGDDGAIDDLVTDAVRIARVRFRANAWGLGALQASPPESFRSDLHVWGRPFLVTGDDTATIAEGIDAYLAAGPDDVDDIARSMLDHLDPGFADRVAPDDSGTLPSPDNLARGIRGHVDILRETVAAHRAGRSELTVGGDHFEPAALIERDLGKVVLDFAAVRAALAALPADPALDTDRRKLDEALADAAHRGLPFAEATEIYSGIMGIMN